MKNLIRIIMMTVVGLLSAPGFAQVGEVGLVNPFVSPPNGGAQIGSDVAVGVRFTAPSGGILRHPNTVLITVGFNKLYQPHLASNTVENGGIEITYENQEIGGTADFFDVYVETDSNDIVTYYFIVNRDLAFATSALITIHGIVDGDATIEESNNMNGWGFHADITPFPEDIVPGNDVNWAYGRTYPSADLQIIKKVSSTLEGNYEDAINAPEGSEVYFKLTAINHGPNDGINVIVEDQLSEYGFEFMDVVSVSKGSYDDATGVWTIGDMITGVTNYDELLAYRNNLETATLIIKAKVKDTGSRINKAEISSDSPDQDETNNEDTAQVNLPDEDVIEAVDDLYGPIDGDTGGITPGSVLDNDTLNGNSIDPNDVTLTPGTPSHPGLTMNTDGTITVAPGTPDGIYTYSYTICSVDFPTICDNAVATVNVTTDTTLPVIIANNDAYGEVSPDSTLPGSIFDNDLLNNAPFDPSEVTLTINPVDLPQGVTVDGNGVIHLDSTVGPGNYNFPYTICSVAEPAECDTANITFHVTPVSAPCFNEGQMGDPLLSHVGILTKGNNTTESKNLNWPEEVPNGYLVLDAVELGMVIPHTTPDKIGRPVDGMLIYDTVDQCVKMYRGFFPSVDGSRNQWNCLTHSCYDGSEADPF